MKAVDSQYQISHYDMTVSLHITVLGYIQTNPSQNRPSNFYIGSDFIEFVHKDCTVATAGHRSYSKRLPRSSSDSLKPVSDYATSRAGFVHVL